MSTQLVIETEAGVLRSHELVDGEYLIGSGEADIPLQYPTVSRQHAKLRLTEGRVLLTDLGSRNGTFVASERGGARKAIPPNAGVTWSEGEPLSIGPFTLRWSRSNEGAGVDFEALATRLAEIYSKALSEDPASAHERLIKSLEGQTPERKTELSERIHYEFHGDGPLRPFLDDPACREIVINGYEQVFVDLGRGLERLPRGFLSAATYEAWAVRTAYHAGRRLDLQHPVCEATLANGARFHAVMSPISARGLSVAVRRFGSAPVDEPTALRTAWLDPEALSIIKQAVATKLNVVISGGTSTGKTSLLNFLCQYLDTRERVLTVEDTVELSPPVENLVQLQARKPNADGVGEISLRQLVQCALRMRPDRIIVGECRGSEVLEMLQALNTGHPGSLTTVHANSTEEALHRLELLALLGATNLSVQCIREWIHSTIDLLIQVERDSAGHRHVSEIARRQHTNGAPTFTIVYKRC